MPIIKFDFTDEAVNKLDELVQSSASTTTRAEVLRKALGIYDYISNKRNEGYALSLSLAKGSNKIYIPSCSVFWEQDS